jgi:DNA-binding NarL/FixJ family response regulator
MDPIRVLVADDHNLVRAGVSSLLRHIENVEVVGEAANGREALEKAKTLQPDIVLMDITMPELNGMEAIERLVSEMPEVRVIVLSVHKNEEYVLRALAGGVAGYLVKDADPLELTVAIKAVASGKRYLASGISKSVIESYMKRTRPVKPGERAGASPIRSLYQLTSRQRETLQLIAEGNSTKEIAQKLRLSVKTVETHRMELMKRLDIHDVSGLVRYAIYIGLVPVS